MGRKCYRTGLYYYRARYYDFSVGRFITEGPLGFDGGGVNLLPTAAPLSEATQVSSSGTGMVSNCVSPSSGKVGQAALAAVAFVEFHATWNLQVTDSTMW